MLKFLRKTPLFIGVRKQNKSGKWKFLDVRPKYTKKQRVFSTMLSSLLFLPNPVESSIEKAPLEQKTFYRRTRGFLNLPLFISERNTVSTYLFYSFIGFGFLTTFIISSPPLTFAQQSELTQNRKNTVDKPVDKLETSSEKPENKPENAQENTNPSRRPLSSLSPTTETFDANKTLAEASQSLNRFKTLTADFLQFNAQGNIDKGKLYFRRPGKARFEYEKPNPLLLVSDGVTLSQMDRELETQENLPLKLTPLSIMLKKNVDLLKDADVTSITFNAAKDVFITLQDETKNMEGELILVFRNKDSKLSFSEWITKDPYGFSTRVLLQNIKENIKINPRYFLINSEAQKNENTKRRRRPR